MTCSPIQKTFYYRLILFGMGLPLAGLRELIDVCLTFRLCGIEYKDAQTDTNILAYSVYFPTSGRDDDFLEVVSSLSADISLHNSSNTALLIGCDSNQSNKSTNRRTSTMKCLLTEFNLKSIVSGDKPTFHHNNQTSESQIDHIYYFIPASS
jgi:endonuclease/exonuclease/phosphatase (EEP) superfamily protein YafD